MLENLALSILDSIKKDQNIEFGELFTLNVPEWITRNTIMLSSSVFNNSLFFKQDLLLIISLNFMLITITHWYLNL